MTSLHLLVANLRHAKLCVLGRKFVGRPSQVRAYLKHLEGRSPLLLHLRARIPPTILLSPR
jgi:hypothetical protein